MKKNLKASFHIVKISILGFKIKIKFTSLVLKSIIKLIAKFKNALIIIFIVLLQERLLLSVLPEHVAVKMRQDLGSALDSQFKKIYMSRHENVRSVPNIFHLIYSTSYYFVLIFSNKRIVRCIFIKCRKTNANDN